MVIDASRKGFDARFFDQPEGEISLLPAIDLRLKETALVIIDMQYHDAHADFGIVKALEIIDPGSTAYYTERLSITVPAIARILDEARQLEIKVIHLIVGSDYRDLRDFNGRMREWIFDLQIRSGLEDFYWSKSPIFQILEELTPLSDETVIVKRGYGAFNSTNIENFLREQKINTLVVTGCVTNYCVETTVRDAADRGFAVVVVDEGTVAFSDDAQRASLASFRGGFAGVIKTADKLIELLRSKALSRD